MNKNIIQEKLNTKILGKNIIVYDIIDSTQEEIKRLNLNNGSVVIAEEQSDGQGTHGRIWYTGNKDKNIALSFILHPNCDINKIENITIIIAECVVNTFKKLYNINLDIKYPNDIVHNAKKIGGILTQTKIRGKIVKKLYIGIGLNILQEEFNKEIIEIATSIKKEFNIECSSEEIIATFFNLFEKEYLKLVEEIYE